MQMLTKFESKSSRAKSVAFHPKRPWILVSLHSSTIQLWDYRMGTIIDRFEGHGGPVRGVDFHKTQPLFASCGDDYTIKVWSLQTRKCLFTLTGHLDYTRTVFFHDDLPWLISCSDDQTIRIWNWQNRQEIACLTGHNHYVMSAQFHPTEDLIVSSSLDQTVRVWDISGLRKKHSAPQSSVNSFEDQLARANAPQQDVFGNTDAVVKYVLEGHDRGVNWASFHPTLPLIISAGDDRVLKLWRMSENKAWEVDTFRGHLNNILCCVFHPYQDLIVSVSEDKTIRTWDLNKRTPVQQFKRDSDKFWHVAVHPSMNLFAAAHDTGVMVFKLERERPASALHQNSLFYVSKDKQLKQYDLASNENLALLSLKKQGSSWTPFRALSYNPAERSVLATWRSENTGHYELMNLPRDSAGAIEPTNVIEGQGDQAVFISRNRFAVLNKKNQAIEIRDLSNSIVKSIATPISTKDIIVAGPSQLMLVGATQVLIMDIQQKKEIAKMPIAGIKYVSWSNDGQYVALLGKHTVTIATKNLETVSSLHETIRIKSATWDESGVLLYSTLNHLKYCLLNGDNGILRTLPNTLYLVKARGSSVYTLTRAGTVEVVRVDPTEYRFKRALINKNFQEVLRIIKTSSLVGQSIISYLQKKGYPEIALQFVQDHQTKFDLAIECGNLEVALEEAKALGKASAWRQLGQEALSQGNHDVVEEIYQKQHDFDRLSFIYLITGNVGRLQKMEQIAEHRSDYAARFQTSIFLNNVEQRIQLLREAGQDPLAYALAKSNGLEDLADDIAQSVGVDVSSEDVDITDVSQDTVPGVAHDTHSGNWPLKQSVRSFFERSLSGELADLSLEASEEAHPEIIQGGPNSDYVEVDNDGEDDGDWDVEVEDLGGDLKSNVAEAQANLSEPDLWIRSSQVPADHIAAGSFESAAQLLNRQSGIANFAPLKPRFLEVYRSSKFYLAGINELAPLKFNAKRFGSENSHLQPLIPDLSGIKSKLDAAYKEFSLNKLELAVETFREVLYVVVTSAASTNDETHFLGECVQICRNYILACSIELNRQKVQSNSQRSLELAAYMTVPKLDGRHAALPLLKATQLAITAKNFASASFFADKILSLPKLREKHREKAMALKNVAGASALDEVEINFNRETNFSICPATLTPIYDGEPFVQDPLTGAKYHASAKGSICRLTGISVVGQPGSGPKWQA